MTQNSTQIQTVEMTLERIAKALETIAANLDGTNERLDSIREGQACLNGILEEATTR